MLAKRRIGKSNLEVTPLCFGGNVFGWTIDEATSFRLLDAFVDGGFDFIDTADVYSTWAPGNRGGESETILGRWFKQSGKRSRVVLATKVGLEMGAEMKGLSKAYIVSAVEDSLRRLKTDVIDLYQSHRDDLDTPVAETLEAYDSLVKAGKVRVIGASNYSSARLLESAKISTERGFPTYECLQPRYNLYDREEFEKTLAGPCRELGISVIPFYSLAAGFLTGKYRTPADLGQSARGTRTVENYLTTRGMRILAALDEVSEELRIKPATISLAWLLAKPTVTAPIASATSLEQLKDLTAAVSIQLSPEIVARLDAASVWQ
jgi:aryl-alcohol dehydrogenase-like predicted oxidoreductase